MMEDDVLQQGSLSWRVDKILHERRYRPVTVAKLSALAMAEPDQVSNALQRLKKKGRARRTKSGWRYRKSY